MSYRLWVIKWSYISKSTNRKNVLDDHIIAKNEKDARRKASIYRQLYENGAETEFIEIYWKELKA